MRGVEVVWYDAYDMSSWMSRAEMSQYFPPEHKGKMQRTLGWLYLEDDNKVVIATTYSPEVERVDEESLSGVLVIPRSWIVEVTER